MKLLGIADLTERVCDDQASEAARFVVVRSCGLAAAVLGRGVDGDDVWRGGVRVVEALGIGTLAFLLVG